MTYQCRVVGETCIVTSSMPWSSNAAIDVPMTWEEVNDVDG